MGKAVIVLGGPNGAGKTTFARQLVLSRFPPDVPFLNADLIAESLSPFRPERAAVEAGREFLRRLDRWTAEGRSFALESTQSGASLAKRLEGARRQGYAVELCYLWLPDPAVALERVRARVRRGGHAIPGAVVVRRFGRSSRNFATLYRPLADRWVLLDGGATPPVEVAAGAGDQTRAVLDEARWQAIAEKDARADVEEEQRAYRAAGSPSGYLDDLEPILEKVGQELAEWEGCEPVDARPAAQVGGALAGEG